jgi:UDP-N-acetylglucosamine diphosphorylase/glucosamine-1-phosphate N-acetyltransferase
MNRDTNRLVRNICIFEDKGFENLLPLTYTRPVFELFCGMSTLREKLVRLYPEVKLHLLCRDYLIPVFKKRVLADDYNRISTLAGEGCLFLNGRLLAYPDLDIDIPLQGEDEFFVHGNEFVAARVTDSTSSKIKPEEWTLFAENILKQNPLFAAEILQKYTKKSTSIEVEMITYPWDLVYLNSWAIKLDALSLEPEIHGFVDPSVTIYGSEYDVSIGTDAEVEAGVVFDASEGPIIIGQHAVITSYTSINGPAFIGAETRVERGKIRRGTSIGSHCRVGGEINTSIFHGYSNKPHIGYIGHSYIGEWVNLEVLTTNSNFNNYDTIEVFVNEKIIDSQKIKVGCFIGDYAQTGIGTLILPGTVIGVGCNIFGGTAPKIVPSFSQGGIDGFSLGQLDKLLVDCQKNMKRRGVEQTEADVELLRTIYQLTAAKRSLVNEEKSFNPRMETNAVTCGQEV